MDHRLKRRPCAAELGGHLAVQLGGRAIWADGVHVSGCASTPDVHWATDLGQSLPDAGNIAAVDVFLKVAVALIPRATPLGAQCAERRLKPPHLRAALLVPASTWGWAALAALACRN